MGSDLSWAWAWKYLGTEVRLEAALWLLTINKEREKALGLEVN